MELALLERLGVIGEGSFTGVYRVIVVFFEGCISEAIGKMPPILPKTRPKCLQVGDDDKKDSRDDEEHILIVFCESEKRLGWVRTGEAIC